MRRGAVDTSCAPDIGLGDALVVVAATTVGAFFITGRTPVPGAAG